VACFAGQLRHCLVTGHEVQLAEGTDDAGKAQRAAIASCLRPSTDAAFLTKVLNLAQRGVDLGKGNQDLPWYQLALGMAEYRNGLYAAADQILTIAEQTGDKLGKFPGTVRCYRAMSLFRQGHPEEARKLFGQAGALMPPPPDDEHYEKHSASYGEVIWWITYKEAKSLLNAPAPGKP
jgi:eukaryotic-like serine/threonine-protein kinase